jgi:sulfonate transport system substrate-binding protein
MTHSRRQFIKTAAALTISAPYLSKPAFAKDEVLRFGDQRGAIRSILEAAGELKSVPYKLEFADFGQSTQIFEAYTGNAVDAGFGGDASHSIALSNGMAAKLVYAERSDPACIGLLVRGDSPYKSLADLKGKTIVTGRGTISHYLVMAGLKQAGMTPQDVQLTFLPASDAQAAFMSGSVDAWATWTIFVAQAVVMNNARVVLNGRGLLTNNAFMSATNQAIAAKRPLLQDFSNRWARARVWAHSHIDEYSSFWATIVKVQPDVAKYAYGLERFLPTPMDDKLIKEFEATTAFYREIGIITKPSNVPSYFDRSFQVDPSIMASVPSRA